MANLIYLNGKKAAWIRISKQRHGAYEKLVNAPGKPDKAKTAEAETAWRKSVSIVQQIGAEIQAEQKRRDKSASTASLDVAKSIAAWEGGRSADGMFRPYQDAVGVWTIGYGHTNADGAPSVGPGTRPLTTPQATALLLHDLNTNYAPSVNRACKGYGLHVTQKEFDALVSFCYNLGAGYFAPSHDIGQAMKAHDGNLLADRMLEYCHAGGQVLAGLLRRRKWEAQLFRGGTYTVN